MSTSVEIEALMGQVEEMWGHLDSLFQHVDEFDNWNQKHGADWTFADVPYHLAYCNRDLVARPIKLGPELPAEARLSLTTVEDVNRWNDRKFGQRPAGQTGRQSWDELRESWEEIRAITSAMKDEDLERPYWMAFAGGSWLTTRHGLLWALSHDWSEFMQLRIHMGLARPEPSPEITTQYLGAAIGGMFPFFLNKEAAEGKTFTTVMVFTDPGVSAFSIRVSEGEATVTPGRIEGADLTITQSAETFEKTFRGIQAMPEALQAGAIVVDNPEGLATFGELFPISL